MRWYLARSEVSEQQAKGVKVFTSDKGNPYVLEHDGRLVREDKS